MADEITPQEMLDILQQRFGPHAGCRALHAKGEMFHATFTATPEARELTRAPHMQGDPVRATARISNGGGNPHVPDRAPDVRGLAVAFHLPDGNQTDTLAQTAPHFAFRTPTEFAKGVAVSKPNAGSLLKLPKILLTMPHILRGMRANLKALTPKSYATIPFFGIHAYKWVDVNGGERWVRYFWQPAPGAEAPAQSGDGKPSRDFLREDLHRRLAAGGVRYTLEVQIAGDGDDPDDPATNWPDDRERVNAGTLEIGERDPDAEGSVFFDPTRVCDGIELSNDPILHFRPKAMALSQERWLAERAEAPAES